MLSVYVIGDPKAQPRPRATAYRSHTGQPRVRVYEPKSAKYWKMDIQRAVKDEIGRGFVPFDGPVTVKLVFCLKRPQAHYRYRGNKLKSTAPKWHTNKPDVDNLAKAVLDALSDVGIWRDDSQVAALRAEKRYEIKAPSADRYIGPGCLIEVEPCA